MNKSSNKTIICPFCGSEIKANIWKPHLLNFHSNEPLIDLISVWNCHAGSKVSVKNNCAQKFIKYLIENLIITDIISAEQFFKTTKPDTYFNLVEQYEPITAAHFETFIKHYIPYRKQNPKVKQSFELAKLATCFDLTKAEDFYNKIFKSKNFYTGHGSELSPFSKEFVGYKDLNETEIDDKIKGLKNDKK